MIGKSWDKLKDLNSIGGRGMIKIWNGSLRAKNLRLKWDYIICNVRTGPFLLHCLPSQWLR